MKQENAKYVLNVTFVDSCEKMTGEEKPYSKTCVKRPLKS